MEETKTCSRCGEVLPLSEFHIQNKAKDKLRPDCKKCRNEEMRIYRNANPEVRRARDLQFKYGITLDDYNVLLAEQDNGCVICGRAQKRQLAVDHDHRTGKVRGLLCSNCNTALGQIDDNIEILGNMISYLKEHNV